MSDDNGGTGSDSVDSVTDVTEQSGGTGGDSADSVTDVTEQSWLGRLLGSFVAALIGLILFIASFPLLYWNEGHAVAAMTALNNGARTVISVPADPIDPANNGHLVHVTGPATLTRPAGDPLFHLAPATAMRLRRHVEAYQWEEHKQTQTEKNVGGSTTTRTTYSYQKAWSDTPIDASKFREPNGHGNPPMTVHSADFDACTVMIGAFRLDTSLLDELTGFQPYALPASAEPGAGNPGFTRLGDMFYHGASADSPAVGDTKVSYTIIEAQPVSIIGAQVDANLATFRGPDGRTIALANLGTHTAPDMFAEAREAANTLTWILRGVGFLVMLIGLCLLAAPLSWLASVLPFLAGIVDAAAFFAALIIAIPLTLATIAVAWIVHRPVIGVSLLIGGIVVAAGIRTIVPNKRLRKV